jgi:hypothetical protein
LFSFFSLQSKAPKEIHAILTETLAFFLPGRAKDLSAPLYMVANYFLAVQSGVLRGLKSVGEKIKIRAIGTHPRHDSAKITRTRATANKPTSDKTANALETLFCCNIA